jgi:hypothetical protein
MELTTALATAGLFFSIGLQCDMIFDLAPGFSPEFSSVREFLDEYADPCPL